MCLYNNEKYMEDVHHVMNLDLPWDNLKDTNLVISGATGMIGSFLIDVILEKNANSAFNCNVFALGRNKEKAKDRFYRFFDDEHFSFIRYDVNKPLINDDIGRVDYILHLASNTHPMLYATDPIGTITTNIIGVQNLLNFAVDHNTKRFLFASSNEMYGENRGDVEFFNEDYCGYINCNTLRAGYPESKRCSEALCQAYIVQKSLDCVIARFTRTYGPTMSMTNTRALSQFIQKGISGENIILKSEGNQFYSYTYMADAVSGLLYTLLCGKNGEAYNIAEEHNDILLKDLAQMIADICDEKVVFEIPNVVEAAGYSKVTKARLNGKKLLDLGWRPKYDIQSGIERTICILKSLNDGI